MEDLILLGQIPGTSLHITFTSWLVLAVLSMSTFLLRYDHTHQRQLWFGLLYLDLRLHRRRYYLKRLDQIAL